MSLPRQVLPGCDYMLTRRCSERRFFLRPDPEANNAFLYCLGLAVQASGVEILFVTAMSNHYHVGLHDPHGRHPEFSERFHGLLARCLNAHRGRFENFWSSEPTSVVRLVEPNDVLEKTVYAYTNPVAADLVDTVDDWPGICSMRAAFTTGVLTARRPRFFFREASDLPLTVSIPVGRPQGFRDLSANQWETLVTERVRRTEAEYRERRRQKRKSILGRQGVLGQKPSSCPNTRAQRFDMNPKVAARSKWARVEALQRFKAFVQKHALAIKAWTAGMVNVLFPFGTYRMRRFANVTCELPDVDPDTPAQGGLCLNSA